MCIRDRCDPRTISDEYSQRLVHEYSEARNLSPQRHQSPNVPADRLYGKREQPPAPRGSTQAPAEPDKRTPHQVPADVRFGLWSCCRSVNRDAAGCQVEQVHWTETEQCVQCGLWFDEEQAESEVCVHHLEEPSEFSSGGVAWGCCDAHSYKGTKYGYFAETETQMGGGVFENAVSSNCDTSHQMRDARRRWGCTRGKHRAAHRCAGSCSRCGLPETASAEGNGTAACTFHPGVWCASRRVRRIANPMRRAVTVVVLRLPVSYTHLTLPTKRIV
eukprot:TRINITY_DN7978_c0_g2_i1.p1 TRINITY_DN7978_c0_g2~~TRINITY_DN7978_c0_g2_i1.p1  ORF type:complete len:274 (+),score=47.80 TRINITY_DN7978_c0_g2_i1:69-890(+)